MLRILVFMVSLASTPVAAGQTQWIKASHTDELRVSVVRIMGRKEYPVGVACRVTKGTLQVRFETKKVTSTKPFYRWNLAVTKPGERPQDVADRLPITAGDQPQRKYKPAFSCETAQGGVVVAFR
ncbi:hypothetical protein LCL97_01425 [Seohaeicola saemankumensis]|nr:hypothetical protein [Seohaeicola saemankumensis]MCA0869473.1 hypothetical protein [Seohaeicola saemankumensis]